MVSTSFGMASARQDGARRKYLAPAVLFVVATLTVLLWMRAVPATVSAVGSLLTGQEFNATVVSCDPAGVCTLGWESVEGPQQHRYDKPGLFAPAPQTQVTVAYQGDQLALAGWSALAEAALLVALAVTFSGFTLTWWRRVLDCAPLLDELPEPSNSPVTDPNSR